MAEIPGRFSIRKMLCKETHDILVIQGIQLFDSIGERIHDPIHLLHFYMIIDVSPRCISTSHQAVNYELVVGADYEHERNNEDSETASEGRYIGGAAAGGR